MAPRPAGPGGTSRDPPRDCPAGPGGPGGGRTQRPPGGPVRLHVAASLDIAPAVQQIGKYFNDLNRDVGGHCAQVEVTEDAPGRVAAELSGMGTITGESPIDAWVPDSSLWLNVVRNSARGAPAARPTGVSVARSPLVITAPRSITAVVGRSSPHIGLRARVPPSLGGPSPSL